MNPVLILTHNCLDLTKKCVESIRKQDIPIHIYVYDNGSEDGTCEWLESETGKDLGWSGSPINDGVSEGWNIGLDYLFYHLEAEHVLVLNNDVIVPSHFYSSLLARELPFVTGRETTDMFMIGPLAIIEDGPLVEAPQFSAFLIRKSVWEKVGKFDTAMKIWASDCDYHARAHRLGVRMYSAPVLYYHERSSSMRLAPQSEKYSLAKQGDRDRAAFTAKWGCGPNAPEYADLFK